MSEKTNLKEEEKTKVVRRGIGSARGPQRLKFTTEMAKPNGLFLGHLDSIELKSILVGEDKTGMPSFNGLEIPRLILTFASNEEDVNKRHYITLSFNAVESNALTIPGKKEEWKVNAVFDWLKHILNVYVLNGRELTEEEEINLSLPFTDFNENGEYEPIDAEIVINGWKQLFENFISMMYGGNKDGAAPVFKTKDNKIIPIWMKLLRYIKGKKGWQPITNGELSFPTFIGEGCIEKYKPNVLPTLRIDKLKECIIIREDLENKAKDPTVLPAMGGIPLVDNMVPDMTDLSMTSDDSPF